MVPPRLAASSRTATAWKRHLQLRRQSVDCSGLPAFRAASAEDRALWLVAATPRSAPTWINRLPASTASGRRMTLKMCKTQPPTPAGDVFRQSKMVWVKELRCLIVYFSGCVA